MKNFVKVVIGLPIDGPFDYAVPEMLRSQVAVGKRVWVPFRYKDMVGYIVALSEAADVENVKPLRSIIDKEPVLDSEMLELTKWMSEYYFSSWGEAIEAAIPGGLKRGRTEISARVDDGDEEFERSQNLKPTPAQKNALDDICKDIHTNSYHTYLLHGVTGSGKTEVYLQAIGCALELGKSSIVLVPEISLTPQTVERFKSRFHTHVAVLHSHLTPGRRFEEWKKVKSGEARIVVGARSAIFAPVKDLGLVVVDEEHENSYKQQDAPRYHAREAAIKRAEIAGAVCVLGSATPSLESYYRAKQGGYKLKELSERIEKRPMPEVEIVDMRDEERAGKKLRIFSNALEKGIMKALDSGLQAILFLNRRGFSTFVNCRKCGHVVKCKHCDSTLTYHFQKKKLLCHWCNWQADPPEICPACEGSYMNYFGLGTEKVESETHRIFLNKRIGRMDTDTTQKRGSHKRILSDFKNRKLDLLVGTQMVAKGLDYPGVALVGVVSADTALHVPDFRSGERTFNLLTQVAGRAGRGDVKGKVVVQTYTPTHYAIAAAKKHDYARFYRSETQQRRQLKLPPFAHIICITLRGRSSEKTKQEADKLSALLRARLKKIPPAYFPKPQVVGPATAIIPRLRMHYRWNIFLKCADVMWMNKILKEVLTKFGKPSGIYTAVDVDPL